MSEAAAVPRLRVADVSVSYSTPQGGKESRKYDTDGENVFRQEARQQRPAQQRKTRAHSLFPTS